MTDATDLWAAVVVSYDVDALVELTNIHDRSKTTINTAVGEDAAQGALNLWPAYAQVAYDATDGLHVEVGKRAVIAMLWERGGSAAEVAKQEWAEVFNDGLLNQLKRTGPRSRSRPRSNSNVSQASGLTGTGGKRVPWADAEALPWGILPRDKGANE